VPSRFPLIGGYGARTRQKNVTVLATQNIRNKKNATTKYKQKQQILSLNFHFLITNAKATIKESL